MKFFSLFIFLSLQTPLMVIGDRRLIESTCKATPSYNLCLSTLLSNPKSSSGNVSDLGLIIVGATKVKTTQAMQRIKTLYRSHPELRDSLNKCGWLYNAVVLVDVPSAIYCFESGQVRFAEYDMADIVSEVEACEKSFSKRSQKSPLKHMNKDIKNVANIARAIIRMLS